VQTLKSKTPEVTVGPANAEVVGSDNTAIQSAVHLAGSRRVDTVRVLKGTYRLSNAIRMPSGIKLVGEGDDTILRKDLYVDSVLVEDAGWYQREVVVRDPDLFPVGCGIVISGPAAKKDEDVHVEASVAGKEGNTLILDRAYIGEDFWLVRGEQKVTAGFRHIRMEDQHDVAIADMQLDGGLDAGDLTKEGKPGGGIFMQNCDRVVLRNIYAHHNNCDAISWQICEHVTLEGCRLEYNALGSHPGSGSQYMVVRDCRFRNNVQGFYYCWGVQHGLMENCEVAGSRTCGISIGFRDSHNVIRDCSVHDNGEVGVLFRTSWYPHQSPKNCLLERCRIENNGPPGNPLAIRLQDAAEDIRISNNTITDARGSDAGVAIRIEKTVKSVSIENNTVSGFQREVVDDRANV